VPQTTQYQPYAWAQAYFTMDGSEIRELMRPGVHGNVNQSLAEATIPVGGKTLLHQHRLTEEIYHITKATGVMTRGEDEAMN
jgi:mannose-6-phosphate isomerase-like protein (cupin superfamily)